MCIIIDTCVIHCVFGEKSKNHANFEAVLTWLRDRDGKMIYGGNKYKKELKSSIGKYRKLFSQLLKSGKIIQLNDANVDSIQKDIENLETNKDFDDPHLIAIIIESGCKILCTNDKRAIKFLKKPHLYPRPGMRPSIYTSKRNKSLVTDTRNIVPICSC